MNKIIKKISLLLTSLGLILLIGGVICSLIFSEQIESAVVKNLKEQIPTNLEIGDVDFQLFDNFPFSTVKINKLYMQDPISNQVEKSLSLIKLVSDGGIGAQIIKDLSIKNMILVSRSKKKIIGLDGFGIKIIKQEIIKWKINY